MNLIEMALRDLGDSITAMFGDLEQDETKTYDCCGMPVELTLPVHGAPLKGCRSEE